MLQAETLEDDQNGRNIRSIWPIVSLPSKNEEYPSLNPTNMFQDFSYHNFMMCKMLNFFHPKCFPISSPLHHG